MKKQNKLVQFAAICVLSIIDLGCQNNTKVENAEATDSVRLITLDPGHFHAALVQKIMYPEVSSTVQVYAPKGGELESHLKLIDKYNNLPENPTSWNENVYKGDDFFEKMLEEKKARLNDPVGEGNVVVLAGNNLKKTEYIKKSVDAGLNVLSDKPMAINSKGFELLKEAFESAKKNNVLLYDIMTERYEITSILQKEFSQQPDVFGSLVKGTIDDPAITKESVHHFFKYVSGAPLIRPTWFFDVNQQGNGLVDVTTHLVDLIQWECFPNIVLDYKKDVQMLAAKRWPTPVTASQFLRSTQKNTFPDHLMSNVKDSVLNIYSNGEMNYTLKGVHTKVSVIWNFEAPERTGDTHYSIMRSNKANLVIRQGKEQNFKPVLYIEPVGKVSSDYESLITIVLKKCKNLSGYFSKKIFRGLGSNYSEQL